MLASPFTAGVGIYVFYALQPYLLELWGDPEAYTVAGLAAALLSGAAIVGGAHRTLGAQAVPASHLVDPARDGLERARAVGAGLVRNFWVAVGLVALWGIASAIDDPVHRAYLNDMIPSKQRATVLSFDSLMGSAGGVVFQPVLGRVADIGGYGASLIWSGVISAVAVPFVLLSRAQQSPADTAREVSEGSTDAEDEPSAKRVTPAEPPRPVAATGVSWTAPGAIDMDSWHLHRSCSGRCCATPTRHARPSGSRPTRMPR